MVKWIYLLLFISVNTSLADISQEVFTSPILGKWKFTEYIYEGKSLPLPNPHLNLFFEFNETGSDRLWWYRNNEDGFCERIGVYKYENEILEDQVVWVNPDNHLECAQHQDMKLGQNAKNKLHLKTTSFTYICL